MDFSAEDLKAIERARRGAIPPQSVDGIPTSELVNSPELWKSHLGSALEKTAAGKYLCVDNEGGEPLIEEFENIEAAVAYFAGMEVDGLGPMTMDAEACARFDHRISEARGTTLDDLVSCRLDNCNGDYSEGGGEGLRALVDLEGTGRRRYGCAVAYFPAESARQIADFSRDPMVGEEAIYWSGDNLVQTFATGEGVEIDYIIPPVIIDGDPYWMVGEDYMWEVLEGPEALRDVMPFAFDVAESATQGAHETGLHGLTQSVFSRPVKGRTAKAPTLNELARIKTDEAACGDGLKSKDGRIAKDQLGLQR